MNMVLPDYSGSAEHQELVTILEEGVTGDPTTSNILVDGRKVAYFMRMTQCKREYHKEGPVGDKKFVYYPGYGIVFSSATSGLVPNKNYTLIFGAVL